MSSTRFLLAFAALATLTPMPALATCMTSCKATLMLEGCIEPSPTDEWPTSQLLGFAAACETCCAAPGGPVNCDAEAPDPKSFKVLVDGKTLVGDIVATGKSCSDEARFSFTTPLQAGNHQLLHGNIIVAQFKAVGKVECITDSDCAACTSCETGACKPLGCKATCKSDADCGKGSQCVQTEPGCCSECQVVADADAGGAGDVVAEDASDAAADSAGVDASAADASAADAGAPVDATGSADAPLLAVDVVDGQTQSEAGETAADSIPAGTPASSSGKSGGCSAAPSPSAPAWPVWFGLVAAMVLALVRSRAGRAS